MSKKIICIIILCSIFFGINPIYAVEGVILEVCSVECFANDEIDITVSIRNNPGLAAFELILEFDNTKLVPVSITQGEVLDSGGITSNVQDDRDLSTLDRVIAVWYSISPNNTDGVMYTVRFSTKDNLSGEIPITLDYNVISDIGFNDIEPVITNGKVTIKPTLKGGAFVAEISQNQLTASNNAITGNLLANVTNNTAKPKIADVYMAIYNDSELIYAKMDSRTTLAPGNNSINFENINAATISESNFLVMVLVWDSNMKPLSYSVSDNIGE